jgi:hypothetical protein
MERGKPPQLPPPIRLDLKLLKLGQLTGKFIAVAPSRGTITR